jgi:hypothetical protein
MISRYCHWPEGHVLERILDGVVTAHVVSLLDIEISEWRTLSELPPDDVFQYNGSYDGQIGSPKWNGGILTIGNSSHIAGVEQDVWEFRMCGYDVCKSWFTAGWKAGIQREGEHLTQSCVLQARTMLWTIRETLRVRREIDELIEKFGGWPLK